MNLLCINAFVTPLCALDAVGNKAGTLTFGFEIKTGIRSVRNRCEVWHKIREATISGTKRIHGFTRRRPLKKVRKLATLCSKGNTHHLDGSVQRLCPVV